MTDPSTALPFVLPVSVKNILPFFSSICTYKHLRTLTTASTTHTFPCVVDTSGSSGKLTPFSRNFLPVDLPMYIVFLVAWHK